MAGAAAVAAAAEPARAAPAPLGAAGEECHEDAVDRLICVGIGGRAGCDEKGGGEHDGERAGYPGVPRLNACARAKHENTHENTCAPDKDDESILSARPIEREKVKELVV